MSNGLKILLAAGAALAMSAPLFAGDTGGGHAEGTPAPIAGLGLGALAAIGMGYGALKRRLGR